MTTQQVEQKTGWVLDSAHASVEFGVKHMVISTVRGRFSKFDVQAEFDPEKIAGSSVVARIDASSIDTREPKRDAHLRSSDFLDVERFPELVFTSRRIEAPYPGLAAPAAAHGRPQSDGEGKHFQIIGDLSIRGVSKEVVLEATFEGLGKDPFGNVHAGFTAKTALNRKEFGLTWNMALETGGVLVGDVVKIEIEAELVKQA